MSQKKQNSAIVIGFFLILLVAAISIFRNYWGNEKESLSVSGKKIDSVQDEEKEISPRELMDLLNSSRKNIVIDLRSPEEFKKEHIVDSINIPPSQIENNLSVFNGNDLHILVDSEQTEAERLAKQILSGDHIINVKYLSGGLIGWKNQFFPLVSDGDPLSFTDQSKVNYIEIDELRDMMQNDPNVLVIDVRRNNTYSDGHLKNAINIFLDELEKKRVEIPKGKKIILYDNDGLWAYKGAVRLFDMGVYNVYALSEGFDGWKEKGYEVVK